MQQNIYDNTLFFSEYKALHEREDNYNVLLEQPAMKKLLPDLTGKYVLDLGCGFGDNCANFITKGACRVDGIDISKNMLSLAKEKNSVEGIEYIHMSMTEIGSLNEKFDLIYSSLAFHYIKDFDMLMRDCNHLLNDGGILLFSQEHPITTCSVNDSNHYLVNEEGERTAYCMSHYADTGLRTTNWYVDGVEKYHRTISDIMNAVAENGFRIVHVAEPLPSAQALKIRPGLNKEFIKPTFLIIKACK